MVELKLIKNFFDRKFSFSLAFMFCCIVLQECFSHNAIAEIR
jgi:hypothetical protein